VRLHVMLGCTLKSALLIMACLGPHTALCTGIATLLCCATLLAFTVPWFTRFVPKHYSQVCATPSTTPRYIAIPFAWPSTLTFTRFPRGGRTWSRAMWH
jgi:hypothetical protein